MFLVVNDDKTHETQNGMIKNGEFSIPRFIEAYTCDEMIGTRLMYAIYKWQSYYNVVEAYARYKGNLAYFNQKLARNIIENGIEYFEIKERVFATLAFNLLIVLNRTYYAQTGRHFKGYVYCKNVKEKMEYLYRFDDAYNSYVSGGHIDFEGR